MKNSIYIDIDTEREEPIMIGKPNEIAPPTTPEETKIMIINDISCLCEALSLMIRMSDKNGYGSKEDLVKASVMHLNNLLTEHSTSGPTE